jgi:hypothetical protein
MAGEIHFELRDGSSVGRLGRDLGALSPHDGRFETAAVVGSSLRPQPENDPSLQITYHELTSFEQKIESWLSVTYMLNNLNRGLGLPDSYP